MAFPDPDTYYTIQALHSGKVFDVYQASFKPGARVLQWGPGEVGRRNQQFVLDEGAKPNFYRLLAAHSNQYLEIENGSSAEHAPLVQRDANPGSQEFELRHVEGEHYQLVAAHSGKALTVLGGGVEDGVAIVQSVYTGDRSQHFKFIRPQARPHTGSTGWLFRDAYDPDGNQIVDPAPPAALRLTWRADGVDHEHELPLTQYRWETVDVPKRSTNLRYSLRWTDAVHDGYLGTFRRKAQFTIDVRLKHDGPPEMEVIRRDLAAT